MTNNILENVTKGINFEQKQTQGNQFLTFVFRRCRNEKRDLTPRRVNHYRRLARRCGRSLKSR